MYTAYYIHTWDDPVIIVSDSYSVYDNELVVMSMQSQVFVRMFELKHFVPENVLYSFYWTLILPYINYGILIWGNTCKIYLDKIFKLQKWTIRIVSNSHYRSHTGPLFSKFNVLNVHDTFKLNLGIFMYKHHSNQLPPIFSTYFTKHVQTHNYPTRNAQNYGINKP